MGYEDEVREGNTEQEIVDCIYGHLYDRNPEFKAYADQFTFVCAGLELYDLLAGYVPAVEKARKSMYFARNLEIIDVGIPGHIPELGSAMGTSVATNDMNEANQVLQELSRNVTNSELAKKIEAFSLPKTNLLRELETLDLIVNMMRSLRLDITSIITVFEQQKNAKAISQILENIISLMVELNKLPAEYSRLDDIILKLVYEEWARISPDHL